MTLREASQTAEAAQVPLDEQALRRPDFLPGTPMRLADGQLWTIPATRTVFVPAETEKGYDIRLTHKGPDEGFEAAAQSYFEAEGGIAYVQASIGVIVAALRRNYSLTIEQLARLVRLDFEEGNEEATQATLELIEVAIGGEVKPRKEADASQAKAEQIAATAGAA